jgi:hypothetical protein
VERQTVAELGLIALGGLFGLALGIAGAPAGTPARAQSQALIYMPLGMKAAGLADLPTAQPGQPAPSVTWTQAATLEPSATATPHLRPTNTATATATELPSATTTPTPKSPGRITGKLTVGGEPAVLELGADPGPGLVLRRCTDERNCEIVDRTGVADSEGGFVFEDPAPLESGRYYQVTWFNENAEGSESPFIGYELWIGAWYDTPIRSYARGQVVDVGTFEIKNVELTQPTHGTGFGGLPIVFGWKARSPEVGNYSWAICEDCCKNLAQRVGAYHTPSLGRRTSYQLNDYPPGSIIGIEHKYCWFVRVEGEDGSHGESYFHRMLWFFNNARAGLQTVAQTVPAPKIFLPLVWGQVGLESLVAAATLAPTVPPTATAGPSDTPSATPMPTDTPTPEPTATFTAVPTPTQPPAPTGKITGRLTFKGEPMRFFGEEGPWIELRRKVGGGPWLKIANAVSDETGRYTFENPPAIGAGEVYQVWWNNPVEDGADLWLHRWWSRDITAFGDGKDVDVGVFELADLILTQPCHDCLQTAPITFGWNARPGERGTYRWAIHDGCGDVEARAGAWRSAPLARATQYNTSPPPGFQYDARLCWYVLIEDGANGSGWPFFDRRVTFCSSPATCRGAALTDPGRTTTAPAVLDRPLGFGRTWQSH